MDVVDGGGEHPAERQRLVLLALDLVEHPARKRAELRHELVVVHGHPHRDLAGLELEAVEDGIERELEVLEVLDGEAQAGGETAENEKRHTVESGLARKRQRDLV